MSGTLTYSTEPHKEEQRGSIQAHTTGLRLKRPQMNLKQQGVYATVFKQCLATEEQREFSVSANREKTKH